MVCTCECFKWLGEVLTLQNGDFFRVAMFGFCAFLANMLQGTEWSKKGPILSFAMLLVCAFGGGFLAPILLSLPEHYPYPLSHDIEFFICLIAWWVRDRVSLWQSLNKFCFVRTAVAVLFELLRAKTLFHWWSVANDNIPASGFAQPLFGPIVIGALGGCGGLIFLKGREFVAAPLNWIVASALIGSTALTLLTSSTFTGPIVARFGYEADALTISKPACHALVAAYFVQTRLFALYNEKQKQD
mgnify:CR=1 FL=1